METAGGYRLELSSFTGIDWAKALAFGEIGLISRSSSAKSAPATAAVARDSMLA
jgi:hypothetical protein